MSRYDDYERRRDDAKFYDRRRDEREWRTKRDEFVTRSTEFLKDNTQAISVLHDVDYSRVMGTIANAIPECVLSDANAEALIRAVNFDEETRGKLKELLFSIEIDPSLPELDKIFLVNTWLAAFIDKQRDQILEHAKADEASRITAYLKEMDRLTEIRAECMTEAKRVQAIQHARIKAAMDNASDD